MILLYAISFYHSSYHPWFEDSQCKKYHISFSTHKSLPLIGLASFPRSGNTWIRYLIEGATGIFTGSFYDNDCMTSLGKISILHENCHATFRICFNQNIIHISNSHFYLRTLWWGNASKFRNNLFNQKSWFFSYSDN